MRDEEVPQDGGLLGELRKIQYAVDADGKYTLVPSSGCDSVNVTNAQAWEEIRDEVETARRRMDSGQVSPLAVYMAATQMDIALLSQYAQIARWRIRRHLKPRVFARLDSGLLRRYAGTFGVSVDQLRSPGDLDVIGKA